MEDQVLLYNLNWIINCFIKCSMEIREPLVYVLERLCKFKILLRKKADTTPAAPSSETMNLIGEIVGKVAPAVVTIETTRLRRRYKGFVTRVVKSFGTGFIVRSDGLILTNAHVVRDAPKIPVRLQNCEMYLGIVEYVDPGIDLALIKIKASSLPVLKLADSRQAKAGETVIALGTPLLKKPVTFGIILNTQVTVNDESVTYMQSGAAVIYGNSGGPLVNLEGETVGINTQITFRRTFFRMSFGISYFAIPSNYAKEFLENAEKQKAQQKTFDRPKYKYLELATITLAVEPLRKRKEKKTRKNGKFSNVSHGLLVHIVYRNTPAHKAGLLRGDIITEIDGKPIYTRKEYQKLIQESSGSIQLTIIRENKEIKVEIYPEFDYD